MSLEDGELSFVYRRESHRVDLLSGHVSGMCHGVSIVKRKG